MYRMEHVRRDCPTQCLKVRGQETEVLATTAARASTVTRVRLPGRPQHCTTCHVLNNAGRLPPGAARGARRRSGFTYRTPHPCGGRARSHVLHGRPEIGLCSWRFAVSCIMGTAVLLFQSCLGCPSSPLGLDASRVNRNCVCRSVTCRNVTYEALPQGLVGRRLGRH